MSLPLFVPAYAPSVTGTSYQVALLLRLVFFGDGYEQRTEDGINTRPRVGQWSWAALEQDDADDIIEFLSDNAITGFRYTFPGDIQRNWRLNGPIDMTAPSGNLRAVSVQVKEIFDQV